MSAFVDKELSELNIFCAEKVMKWKRVPSVDDISRGDDGVFSVEIDGSVRCRTDESGWHYFDPTYSNEYAMQVLRKCLLRLNSVGRVMIMDAQGCTFSIQDNGARYKLTVADTLPLTICCFAERLFQDEKV